jgi:hypothetical protein
MHKASIIDNSPIGSDRGTHPVCGVRANKSQSHNTERREGVREPTFGTSKVGCVRRETSEFASEICRIKYRDWQTVSQNFFWPVASAMSEGLTRQAPVS